MLFGRRCNQYDSKLVQSKLPPLHEVEAVQAAFKTVWAAEEPNIYTCILSQLYLRFGIEQLAGMVKDLRNKVARMRSDCDRKAEDLLFEHDGL